MPNRYEVGKGDPVFLKNGQLALVIPAPYYDGEKRYALVLIILNGDVARPEEYDHKLADELPELQMADDSRMSEAQRKTLNNLQIAFGFME